MRNLTKTLMVVALIFEQHLVATLPKKAIRMRTQQKRQQTQ